MKKILSFVIAMAMLATCAFAAVPSDFTDIPNDWSKTAIENAITNGLLNGSNGKVNAGANLTRAEMCAIIARAAKAQNIADISFTDVAASDWFYNEVAKAVGMEVFFGSGTKANPKSPITREETMAIVARFLKLDNVSTDAELGKFADAASVSAWAKDSVAAMINSGIIGGSNGKINPKKNITRAEFAAIMDRVVKTYISANTATAETLGNTMINAGTLVENKTINGDLIIGDGITGTLTLKNVTVTGRILVRGGANVKIEGGSVAKISVASDNTTVNVSATTTYVEANGKVLDGADSSKIVVAKKSTGGGGGGPAGPVTPSTQNPDNILTYAMMIDSAAHNGVVTGDAEGGYTVTVDLSACDRAEMISTGKATTTYGSDLKIGTKAVATNADVSIAQLIGIIGGSSTKTEISVGALALMMADYTTFSDTIITQTGSAPTAGVVDCSPVDGFTVKATMTHDGKVTNVTFVFKLPQ